MYLLFIPHQKSNGCCNSDRHLPSYPIRQAYIVSYFPSCTFTMPYSFGSKAKLNPPKSSANNSTELLSPGSPCQFLFHFFCHPPKILHNTHMRSHKKFWAKKMIFRGVFGLFYQKYPKGGPLENFFFSFLFNTEFYCGISKETMTMLFRGLTILKSPKLIIKGGLCYGYLVRADGCLIHCFASYDSIVQYQ